MKVIDRKNDVEFNATEKCASGPVSFLMAVEPHAAEVQGLQTGV